MSKEKNPISQAKAEFNAKANSMAKAGTHATNVKSGAWKSDNGDGTQTRNEPSSKDTSYTQHSGKSGGSYGKSEKR